MIHAGNNPSIPTRARLILRAVRHLGGKALTIFITIFVGVFITVLLANQPSQRGLGPPKSPFETSLESQVALLVRISMSDGTIGLNARGYPDQDQINALTEKLRDEAGLNLPFLPRYLLWTTKALTFDWGLLDLGFGRSGSARSVILQYLPNTLLLIGVAYLLIFLIGMPLSLYLARNYGGRADRFFAVLAPISSVPSWVFAILLVAVFAVQLHWLPFGGKFDFEVPQNPVGYALVVAKHMILPVAAIMLSLLFQVVYTWRTFFVIYSEEDYVDLARAKGLSSRILERQYILRPALPYVITSFVTTLITFWQLSMAQEAVFQWPGLGLLYIKEALPDFFGDSMDPGELIIVVAIVVIFAYLLGALVFLLDLVYVMIDPRILLTPANNIKQTSTSVRLEGANWGERVKSWVKRRRAKYRDQLSGPEKKRGFSWSRTLSNFKEFAGDVIQRSRLFFQELRRYPSAIFGLTVIVILLLGSIYAVIGLPYEQIGKDYDENRMTGRSYRPRTAMPGWMNWFSKTPWLSTLLLDENSPDVSVSTRLLENGWTEKTTVFTFDYSYREIPSDVFLYFDPKYVEKVPFASLEWMTPDGRTIKLKDSAVAADNGYDFKTGIHVNPLLNQNPAWKNWFIQTGQYPTSPYMLLFAKPGASQPVPQHGKYQLTVTSLLFEEGSELKPQLVLLGQVYGLAGTDYGRRDLMVPLFWGMPFALLIGLVGTLITTLVAMLLPAIGVWYGGWVDALIQRLTEINMVLPSLTIAVLVNVLFNLNIWVVLAIVVVINSFGSPIKTLRSAFLQAKEAPYIETARSYGASDFRIITRYLVPRILPVLIPLLVSQVPSFIFWEATLGLFNIKSPYPSWGRIIYDGLSRGALYGSAFWVLEPIFLLLLTSLAFAMLGSSLERILNPRMIDSIPVISDNAKQTDSTPKKLRFAFDRRILLAVITVFAFILVFILFNAGRNKINATSESRLPSPAIQPVDVIQTPTLASIEMTPTPVIASSPTPLPASASEASSTPMLILPTASLTATPNTAGLSLPTFTPSPAAAQPTTYTLHPGEFPYCIARRFDVDPNEMLASSGLANQQVFYSGTVFTIPQAGKPFPGNRVLQPHPTIYTVARQNETLYSIACFFGDLDPAAIARVNGISVDSALLAGQQLNIP